MADLIDRDAVRKAMRDCETVTHSIGYSDMIAIIDDAPAVNRWIPCRERLPEIKVPVLVTVYNHRINSYVRKIGAFLGDEWIISNIFSETMENVVAWMPLPDAYEPPESEVQRNE